MASRSVLTEEGRTRIRNFSGRLTSYLILWIVIGFGVVIGCIWARTRHGYQPLQRLYLGQYIKASIRSYLPTKRPSHYILLVRVIDDQKGGRERIIGCTDDEVTPIRDDAGHIIFDRKLGPFFRLNPGIPKKYFYWSKVSRMDADMYSWLRSQIYQGHSLPGLYWICFLPLPVIFVAGMIMSIKLDLRSNQEYEEGALLRGIRLLNNSEYAREAKHLQGLGLPVLSPKRD